MHKKDDNGTIYYFNDRTGESRWEKPSHVEGAANQLASMALSPPPPSSSSAVVPNEDIELEQEGLRKLNPAELSQLVSTMVAVVDEKRGWVTHLSRLGIESFTTRMDTSTRIHPDENDS